MSDDFRIERGQRYKSTADSDGFPAVLVTNPGLSEAPGWVTVSAVDSDAEQLVRDLAQSLTDMADQMAKERAA